MVKTGHTAIRRVRYLPPAAAVGDIEANTLSGIRDRGGPHEFLTPQRLDFDLLVHIESGTASHTVDFAQHHLKPGGILWVRAGQVHQWGAIADIEGDVLMFGPHSVDTRTNDLIGLTAIRPRNHWSADELAGTPVMQTLRLMTSSTEPPGTHVPALREASRAHLLSALLAELTLTQLAEQSKELGSTHEVFAWFRNHIEEHFREWHKVSEYAERLGYSSRTLNRLARKHTGLSAKQLIDERIVLEAKRQLSHADAAVADLAQHLGFDDASNFSSYFRRHTNTTPGTFRGQNRRGRNG